MKAVIVEDEPQSREYLSALVVRHAPFLEICAVAATTEEAVISLNRCKPDLAFLDIELYGNYVFDIFNKIEQKELNVIFTTAFEQFALSAIRIGAIDYLLKPYSEDDFLRAIDRVKKLGAYKSRDKQADAIDQVPEEDGKRLIVSDQKEIYVLPYEDIIKINAEGNYSTIYTVSGKTITISKLISEIEAALVPGYFCRIHKSHIVNLQHILRYVKGRGGEVIMKDGSVVYVASRKKDDFLKLLMKS